MLRQELLPAGKLRLCAQMTLITFSYTGSTTLLLLSWN